MRGEVAGYGAAAEVCSLIAHSLFIGKTDDVDGKRELAPLMVDLFDTGDGEQYAERAVELAGVAHGVKMGAEQEGFCAGAGNVADQIANGILADRHAGLAHPRSGQAVGAPHGRGSKQAGQAAGFIADRSQFFDPPGDLCGKVHLQLPR